MSNRAASILIVDDEIQNRRLLEALLRPKGYRTVSVASGEDALASVALSAPDLILLDVMMPGMDGYQVARTLKAEPSTSNIPIIMVTAQVDRSARLAGLEAGAEEFLSKPIDRAELWLRVRNLLRLKSFGDFLQGRGPMEQTVQQRTDEPLDVQARFNDFMESSPVLAWVHDADGHFLYTNKAWNDVSGIDPRDDAGKTKGGAEQFGQLGKLSGADKNVLATGEIVQQPVWIPEKDGSFRCWNSVKFPIREASGRIVVAGIGIDITQQKLAEMEVLSLNADLEQRVIDRTADLKAARGKADRANQDKSDYLGAMARQIAAPLDCVIGLISELRGSTLDESQREMVDSARVSADSMQLMVEDFLVFSKAQPIS